MSKTRSDGRARAAARARPRTSSTVTRTSTPVWRAGLDALPRAKAVDGRRRSRRTRVGSRCCRDAPGSRWPPRPREQDDRRADPEEAAPRSARGSRARRHQRRAERARAPGRAGSRVAPAPLVDAAAPAPQAQRDEDRPERDEDRRCSCERLAEDLGEPAALEGELGHLARGHGRAEDTSLSTPSSSTSRAAPAVESRRP